MVKRFHAKVYGKVQGVFYRATVQKFAKALNIKGFVRNLPDRTVEIDAQGSSHETLHFLRLCQFGPPNAQVEKVLMTWKEPDLNSNHNFEITS